MRTGRGCEGRRRLTAVRQGDVGDGYAVRTADLEGIEPSLAIGELITAGRNPSRALKSREAAVIMTRATHPGGLRRCRHARGGERTLDGVVVLEQAPIKPGQNVLPHGGCAGNSSPGARGAYPAELGVLASVGKAAVRVAPRPRVAVVPTGDELVEPGETPGPGKIRNSNAVMLQRLRPKRAHCQCSADYADEPALLGRILERALSRRPCVGDRRRIGRPARDRPGITRIAGCQGLPQGESQAGQAPLVWGRATARGRPRCSRVRAAGKPGERAGGSMLFVLPALAALSGRGDASSRLLSARLARRFFSHRGDRDT